MLPTTTIPVANSASNVEHRAMAKCISCRKTNSRIADGHAGCWRAPYDFAGLAAPLIFIHLGMGSATGGHMVSCSLCHVNNCRSLFHMQSHAGPLLTGTCRPTPSWVKQPHLTFLYGSKHVFFITASRRIYSAQKRFMNTLNTH